MGKTLQQYEDRVRARLGDLGLIQHIEETQIPLALEEAVLEFSKDKPRKFSETLSGDGSTHLFDLTALLTEWSLGWSRVVSVEHPIGDIPPTRLDQGHDFEVDDETGEILFYDAPVNGTDNVKITYLATYPFPDDTPATDLIPEIYFNAVASKAAASALRAKANEYARQQSTSVSGDLFRRDPAQLFEGANALDKVYKSTVLGRPADEGSSVGVAMAVSDVDVFPHSLFHRRSQLDG